MKSKHTHRKPHLRHKNKPTREQQVNELAHHLLQTRKPSTNLFFNLFAKKTADIVGNAFSFIFALAIIIIWGVSGSYFHYSDTWQLVINTGTTIITFLIVFLIQNTQNRDTEILNLKLDELIKAKKNARNDLLDLHELSDSELKELEQEYIRLKNKRTGN